MSLEWTGFSPDGERRERAVRVRRERRRQLRGEYDHGEDEGKANEVGNAKGDS